MFCMYIVFILLRDYVCMYYMSKLWGVNYGDGEDNYWYCVIECSK